MVAGVYSAVSLGVVACGVVVSAVAAVDDVGEVEEGSGAAAYRNTLTAQHLDLALAGIPAAFAVVEVVEVVGS